MCQNCVWFTRFVMCAWNWSIFMRVKFDVGVQGFSGNEGLPGPKGGKGEPGLAGPRGPKGKNSWETFLRDLFYWSVSFTKWCDLQVIAVDLECQDFQVRLFFISMRIALKTKKLMINNGAQSMCSRIYHIFAVATESMSFCLKSIHYHFILMISVTMITVSKFVLRQCFRNWSTEQLSFRH